MPDYDFLPVSDGSGDAALMHIEAIRLVGATIIVVDSIAGVPAKFIASYGILLSSGFIDPATKRDFKGHTSGSNLVIDAFEPGSTDDGNTAGQVIVIKPNTGWANRVAQAIKNLTNFGTPEDITVNNLDVAADLGVDGALSVDGAATLASLVLSGALTGTGLSSAIQTYTPTISNSSSGTFAASPSFYLNMAGFKIAIAIIGCTASAAQCHTDFTWPPGFFNTIMGWGPMINSEDGSAFQIVSGDSLRGSPFPTGAGFYISNTSNGSGATITSIAFGT